MERWKSEADHHRPGDSHGRATAACALQERAESEGDQQDLQPSVIGNAADGFFDDFELFGFDRDLVNENRGDYDPSDTKPAVNPLCFNQEPHESAMQHDSL